jgi:hypothetical protein
MFAGDSREAIQNTQVVKITASKFHFTPNQITLVKGQPVTPPINEH